MILIIGGFAKVRCGATVEGRRGWDDVAREGVYQRHLSRVV